MHYDKYYIYGGLNLHVAERCADLIISERKDKLAAGLDSEQTRKRALKNLWTQLHYCYQIKCHSKIPFHSSRRVPSSVKEGYRHTYKRKS